LDLVAWQLRVAAGQPLPLTQDEVRFSGHAVEVRLCAEDMDFTPHTGTVLAFQEPPGMGIALRFDHAIEPGLQVSPYYDAMLGKLIAHAPTRAQAISRLHDALAHTQLLGLPSNRLLLMACLAHPVFAAGQARIPFLAESGDEIRQALQKQEQTIVIPSGHWAVFGKNSALTSLRNPFHRPTRLRHRGQLIDLPERAQRSPVPDPDPGPHAAPVTSVRLPGATPAPRWHVQLGAVDVFIEDASFDPPQGTGADASLAATALRAPFNGKLVALDVAVGDALPKGAQLLVIESMKLAHSLLAPRALRVAQVHVSVGQQVVPGQLLLSFEPA
jgi:3-methylcrotonyl-CoA carboxylase alpha subunit/geranyl-CoA carboxylase alpha subunit